MITFSRLLLDIESGIDADKGSYYEAFWEKPVMPYWCVERPGRCIRDDRGELVSETITVHEYFHSIGVGTNHPPFDKSVLSQMQFQSINPLGFVGFQFGEQALWQLGIYTPSQARASLQDTDRIPTRVFRLYIGGVPNSTWSGGVRECRYVDPVLGTIQATDTNEWQGTFTGKLGVGSFPDLLVSSVQFAILTESVNCNFEMMWRLCNARRATDICDFLLNAKSSLRTADGLRLTLSGMAAACHLVGATAVAEHLIVGTAAYDETGTSITTYLEKFSEAEFDIIQTWQGNVS